MKKTTFYIALFGIIGLLSFNPPQQEVIVRGTNVNIRSCPDLSCGIITKANTGDRARLVQKDKVEEIAGLGIHPWYQINIQGTEGYIFGAFIDLVDTPVAITQPLQTHATITADRVNARACAGLNCATIFQLNQQDQVTILGKTNPYFIPNLGREVWYEIEANGQKGFVFGKFVNCKNCEVKPTNTPTSSNITTNTSTKKGTIIGDKVNVRACAATNCAVQFQLDIGANCRIIDTKIQTNAAYPWHEIEHNGTTGFVYGKFLSQPSNTTSSSKVWAIIAGVSDYSTNMNRVGATDLTYSDNDAKRIYQFLKSPEGGNLPDHQIQLLRNSEARANTILQSMDRLFQQAKPDDLIIVYLSGHGGPNYFMAYDKMLPYATLKSKIERSPAKKRLCIADACHSGTWGSKGSTQKAQQKMTPAQLERLYYDALSNSGNGIALFMSSRPNETSLESPNLQQGLFTYHFIEGLKGKADQDADRIITIQELYEFVKTNVHDTASRYFQHQQTPVLSGMYDSEMPIGVVR